MTDATSLPEEFALLQEELSRLTDRRFARGKVFPLAGVLCLAVLSLICGCRPLSAIHRFGDTHPESWPHLKLPRSPSVPTLSRLLRMVSVGELRQVLMRFALELAVQRRCSVGVVAMDGKAMMRVACNFPCSAFDVYNRDVPFLGVYQVADPVVIEVPTPSSRTSLK